jgi:hypothetical protein
MHTLLRGPLRSPRSYAVFSFLNREMGDRHPTTGISVNELPSTSRREAAVRKVKSYQAFTIYLTTRWTSATMLIRLVDTNQTT